MRHVYFKTVGGVLLVTMATHDVLVHADDINCFKPEPAPLCGKEPAPKFHTDLEVTANSTSSAAFLIQTPVLPPPKGFNWR